MKSTIISIIVGLAIIGGAIVLAIGGKNDTANTPSVSGDNVSIVNGKQIIDLRARGGYEPRRSVAESGLPTSIKFKTAGTFDCSSSVRIPSLKISKYLPQTGSTEIDIGTSTLGLLRGSCGMGMYPFEIDFQ